MLALILLLPLRYNLRRYRRSLEFSPCHRPSLSRRGVNNWRRTL